MKDKMTAHSLLPSKQFDFAYSTLQPVGGNTVEMHNLFCIEAQVCTKAVFDCLLKRPAIP